MTFNEIRTDSLCDFCNKKKPILKFDKFHGIDCSDREGFFCLECIKDINGPQEYDYPEPDSDNIGDYVLEDAE